MELSSEDLFSKKFQMVFRNISNYGIFQWNLIVELIVNPSLRGKLFYTMRWLYLRKGIVYCQRASLKASLKLCYKNILKNIVKTASPKRLTGLFWNFSWKNLILGLMPQNTLKIGFFGFKSYTIMIFMILLKPYVWEKSDSEVKCKNAVGQSYSRIFKL